MAKHDEKRSPFGERKKVVIHADWWPDGDEVVIVERTWGARQRLSQKMLAGDTGIKLRDLEGKRGKDALMDKELRLDIYQPEAMLLSIESWTLKYPDGQPVPVTLETIGALSEQDGDFIMEAIQELNPVAATEDEKSGLADSSADGQGAAPA